MGIFWSASAGLYSDYLYFVKFVKGKYNRNWYVSVISVIVGSLAFMGISTLVMWIAGVPLVSFLYLLYIGVPLLDIMQYVHFTASTIMVF